MPHVAKWLPISSLMFTILAGKRQKDKRQLSAQSVFFFIRPKKKKKACLNASSRGLTLATQSSEPCHLIFKCALTLTNSIY